MVSVLTRSCLFLNDKSNLQKKINDLIFQSQLSDENDKDFLINIKKRNNSILGFHREF